MYLASLPFAVATELLFVGLEIMKRNTFAVIAILVVLLLIVLPVVLEARSVITLSGATAILFNVLLTAASVAVSALLVKPFADAEARRQWLPFAEAACSSLLTIASSAERLRRQQLSRCRSLEGMVPAGQQAPLKPLLTHVESQCKESADRLAAVREQIRDARRSWESFIRMHCTGDECAAINLRLGQAEQDLRQTLDDEIAAPSCEQSSVSRS